MFLGLLFFERGLLESYRFEVVEGQVCDQFFDRVVSRDEAVFLDQVRVRQVITVADCQLLVLLDWAQALESHETLIGQLIVK